MADEWESMSSLGGLSGLDDNASSDWNEDLQNFDETFSENTEMGGLQEYEGQMDFRKDEFKIEEIEGGLRHVETGNEPSDEQSAASILADLDKGLTGLGDGTDGSGLSGDASMQARDAANMANRDPVSSIEAEMQPQSLKEFATMGMGNGLSAVKESLGAEGGGIELHASLEEEEEAEAIHAKLVDEEEEAPIQAGRADPAPINAGYGKPQQAVGGRKEEDVYVDFNATDAYDITDNSLASDAKQNIDDIFIAGNFRSGSGNTTAPAAKGTMYHGENEKTEHLHVTFVMPSFLKKILIFAAVIAILYGVLEYGFKVGVKNYFKPLDVQQYYVANVQELGEELHVKFKNETKSYTSSTYDYTYDISNAGGLKIVNYQDQRMYIEVTGMRINYSIFGIRPQMTKYDEAVNLLAAQGYTEIGSYAETEELGSMGEEHVFYNQTTGEGVIIGKKSNYEAVKAVKYTQNYKKYEKKRKELRGEE